MKGTVFMSLVVENLRFWQLRLIIYHLIALSFIWIVLMYLSFDCVAVISLMLHNIFSTYVCFLFWVRCFRILAQYVSPWQEEQNGEVPRVLQRYTAEKLSCFGELALM